MKLTSFKMLTLILTLLFSIIFLGYNHWVIHHVHPNHCAMTYFQGDLTPLSYPHPFYEIAEFAIHSPTVPATHEMFITNDKSMSLAEKRSFPTQPNHLDDDQQHLVFFFPGNAGNRWQARSLGTKIDMYITEIAEQFESFGFNGVIRPNERFEPNLTQLPPRFSYLMSKFSSSKQFRSSKAFYSKYYKTMTVEDSSDVFDTVNSAQSDSSQYEWHDSTNDLLYRTNVDEFLKFNPQLQKDENFTTMLQTNHISTHLYTFSFHEQASAFSGYSLEQQQEYSIHSILRVIEKYRRQFNGYINISLVGHSMGGVVAMSSVEQLLAAIKGEKLNKVNISSVVTIGTPVVPLYIPDHYSLKVYDEANAFTYKHEHCHESYGNIEQQKQHELCNIAVAHFNGGQGDELVPTDYTAAVRYQHYKHPLTVQSTDLAVIRGSSEHDCLAYCAQIMENVASLLLRKSMLDGLIVTKVDLINTTQDPHKRDPLYPRPQIEQFRIDERVLYGNYDKNNRIEFATIMSVALSPSIYDTSTQSKQSNINLLPPQLPNMIELEQQIATLIPDLQITYADLDKITQPFTSTPEEINILLPAYKKSVQISDLIKNNKNDQLFNFFSEIPSTLQLCPNTSKLNPRHECIELNQFYQQNLLTPALSYPIWKQPHTVRAAPDSHDYYRSRSSRYNHKKDYLPGDEGYLQPRETMSSEHGFGMIISMFELYSFLTNPNNFIKFNPADTNVPQQHHGEFYKKNFVPHLNNFDTFVKNFKLQVVISPIQLEGIMTVEKIANLDNNWANVVRLPLVWATLTDVNTIVKDIKNNKDNTVLSYQIVLPQLDSSSKQITPSVPIVPTADECEVLSTGLVLATNYPIIAVDVMIFIPSVNTPTSTPITYKLSQTHHFAPTSPYTNPCLFPTHQRLVQGKQVNAVVDLTIGRIIPRPATAPKIEYDKENKSNKDQLITGYHTTLGLLYTPSHLTSSLADSVTITAPESPQKSLILTPVLLPQDFNSPYMPKFIHNVFQFTFSTVFSMLVLALKFALIITIYRLFNISRHKRWLSTLIDHYDLKDINEELNNENNNKEAKRIIAIESKSKQKKTKSCCRSAFGTFTKWFFSIFIALVFTAVITIPLVFKSNPHFKVLLPPSIVSFITPLVTLQQHAIDTITATNIIPIVTNNINMIIERVALLYNQIWNSITQHVIYQQFYDGVVVQIIIPFTNWVCSRFTLLEYIFNHQHSPIAIIYSTAQFNIHMTRCEYWTSIFMFYFFTYILAQLILTIISFVAWIISLPIRLVVWANTRISTLRTLFVEFIVPLWLLFVYLIPLVLLFGYSALFTLKNYMGEDFIGSFVIKEITTIDVGKIVTEIYTTIHCFFKQGVYFAIHFVANILKPFLTTEGPIVEFMKQFPKNHPLTTIFTTIQNFNTDMLTYTRTSEARIYQCMVSNYDVQLLPIPVNTATILLVTFIWTLLFVIILAIMVDYQYGSIDEYISMYYNKKESKKVLDDVKKQQKENQDNNDVTISDGVQEETRHLLNRIVSRDIKISKQHTRFIYATLIIVVLYIVLLILPSTQVISDVANLSMKQTQYRELYQLAQNDAIKIDDLKVKLNRYGLSMEELQKYGPETATFSLFYLLFNKFTSQVHNIQAKLLVSAMWYQQRGAWMPTTPVDMHTSINFHTTLAFTLLLGVQVLAIFGYFYYINNAKARINDITRSLLNTSHHGDNDDNDVDDAVDNQADANSNNRHAPIPTNPALFTIVVNTMYTHAFITTLLISAIVILPYYLPRLLQVSHDIKLISAQNATVTLANKESTLVDKIINYGRLVITALGNDLLQSSPPASPQDLTSAASTFSTIFPYDTYTSVYSPFLLDSNQTQFPLYAMLTPYHQSLLVIPLLLIIVVISIIFSFDFKLVIPNEVERGYKLNRVS